LKTRPKKSAEEKEAALEGPTKRQEQRPTSTTAPHRPSITKLEPKLGAGSSEAHHSLEVAFGQDAVAYALSHSLEASKRQARAYQARNAASSTLDDPADVPDIPAAMDHATSNHGRGRGGRGATPMTAPGAPAPASAPASAHSKPVKNTGKLFNYTVSDISLLKTHPHHTPLQGDYYTYSTSTITDSHDAHINTGNKVKQGINNYMKNCSDVGSDSGLISALNDENAGIQDILINLIKKQKKINCCDNIDLSKYVLKTSIPPCSNVMPDKYKKYGEKYNPNTDSNIPEDPELHPVRIQDKFSIGYISLISLISVIILLNILK